MLLKGKPCFFSPEYDTPPHVHHNPVEPQQHPRAQAATSRYENHQPQVSSSYRYYPQYHLT